MKTRLQLRKKEHQTKIQPSVYPGKDRGSGTAHHPAYAKIRQLQRVIGNRAFGRLIMGNTFTNPAQIYSISDGGLGQASIRPRTIPGFPGRIARIQKRTPVAEYKRSRVSLGQELRRINKIADASRRQKSQQVFLKKILVKILHHNPFAIIEVKKIPGTVRAETEWINPAKKSLGIKGAFDEGIFKDPLVMIIATVIHESAHADQLKAGVEYYPAPNLKVTPVVGVYLEALNYFAEADVRIDTLYKFSKVLPGTNVKQIYKEISHLLKKADNLIGTMNAGVYRYRGRQYQRKLTAVFTGKKLKRSGEIKTIWKRDKAHLGLKNDLFPWKRLP